MGSPGQLPRERATGTTASSARRLWFAGTVSALESAVGRALTQVSQRAVLSVKDRRTARQSRDSARTLIPTRVVDGLLAGLDAAQVRRLDGYLSSPDFEEIALQYLLGQLLDDEPWEDLQVNLRHEIRHGLRNHVGLAQEDLYTAAYAVFDALTVASAAMPSPTVDGNRRAGATAALAHLVAAAAANSRLLRTVGNLAAAHDFADRLRAQVVAVNGHMRLPHLGVSQAVPYGELYVTPILRPETQNGEVPNLAALPLPGRRSVVLGDPGAGKSTLAAKLAHDVAADLVPGAEGRVPFLLVLREFAGSFREGGKGLVHYLEQVCRAPYNLEPSSDVVGYLLGNGRAVVLLDGLDELVEPELRRRFVQLVDGFVARFPLVPIVVTARWIGYSDAPLDRRMFTVGVIAELTDEQVEQYTRRWFALDASTPAADRARMAAAFVAESQGIADLRANPLLLALLCAMYSSEHYIPTNLAQIYERCAVMLFDRWDVMRGIAQAPQFHGRLRAAVQHLAWEMFTDEESSKALPRYQVVRLLAAHLITKQFDNDDAIATAEQFFDFCSGRAWILTDVGATHIEPRYGFTHRTFLEFFAAEHLVRTHPSADLLWEVLQPRVRRGEWEVVTQIALQLLDRNMDDGADEFLRPVLADLTNDDDKRAVDVLGFAARTLGYVHPGYTMIGAVTNAALEATLTPELDARYHYWSSLNHSEALRTWDGALHTLMYESSPGNRSVIRRALTTGLGELVDAGDDTACFVVTHLGRHFIDADPQTAQFWVNTQRELQQQHATALAEWRERTPWDNIVAATGLERTITTFGPWPLYLADLFLTGSLPSVIDRLFNRTDDTNLSGLRAQLLHARTPWISDHRWWLEPSDWESGFRQTFDRLAGGVAWSAEHDRHVDLALLFLPYLETYTSQPAGFNVQGLPSSTLVHELASARMNGVESAQLEQVLRASAASKDVRSFLTSWANADFDIVVRPPSIWHAAARHPGTTGLGPPA